MKKRLISTLIIVCLVLGMVPTVFAENTEKVSGIWTYVADEKGVTIIGCDSSVSGEVFIPETIDGLPVTTLGINLFQERENITKVNIPSTVEVISKNCFRRNDWGYGYYLEQINVHPENKYYSSVDGVLLTKDGTEIICCPRNYRGTYVMPDTVLNVREYAFSYCENIDNIVFSKNLKRIGNKAFYYCKQIPKVILPEGLTTIGDAAFFSAENVFEVYLPKTVIKCGANAFLNTAISMLGDEKFSTGLSALWFTGSKQQYEELSKSNIVGTDKKKLIHNVRDENIHFNCCVEHTYENICDKDCNICGFTIEPVHSLGEFVSDGNATKFKDGTKTAVCTLCGDKITVTEKGTKLEMPTFEIKDTSAVFSDIKANDWYKEFVDYVYSAGIFDGTDKGFSPDTVMTRAQMVQVLANFSGVNTDNTNVDTGFTDVKPGVWYAAAVNWAAENKIVEGYNGEFTPDLPLTRQQLCLMLVNYAENYLGVTLEAKVRRINFRDAYSSSTWARGAIEKCQRAQIVTGIEMHDGPGGYRFEPKTNVTRAVAATILTNFEKYFR